MHYLLKFMLKTQKPMELKEQEMTFFADSDDEAIKGSEVRLNERYPNQWVASGTVLYRKVNFW